jgi:CheY-like chemotaxis protein
MVAVTATDADVLVVEDDGLVREKMGALLETRGYRVAAAGNGREALNYLRTHPAPHVILLDLMMPVMNGWAFRKEQRHDPALAGIPVLVCSGAGDVQAEADLIGADGHLEKPVKPDELFEAVGRFCAHSPA